MINELGIFLAGAVLIEALVEYAKEIKDLPTLIGALVAGILIAFLFNIHMFTNLGLPIQFPIADVILSGVILSRGSNYTSDIIGKLRGKFVGDSSVVAIEEAGKVEAENIIVDEK